MMALRRSTVAFLPLFAAVGAAPDARAICDVVPQMQVTYRGPLGSLDRPWVMPGDTVKLDLHTAICDGASPGFPSNASKVVTIVYPSPAFPHAVILASASYCSNFSLLYASQCSAQLGAGTATCIPTSLGGDASTTPIPWPAAMPSGPAKIAVTTTSSAPPCQLATQRCADASGLRACVDELYEMDGTCGLGSAQRGRVFPHFTGLPQPNDFAAACTAQPGDVGSPCLGTEPSLRITTDAEGNALIPFDWTKVLVAGGLPVPRLVKLSTTFPAFASPTPPLGGPGDPIRVPGASFLSSHSSRGHRVPPVFQPLSNANELFGSVDAERGVVRIARRSASFQQCAGDTGVPSLNGFPCNDDGECGTGSCGPTTCRGGTKNGAQCASDAQCPGGECGPGLFELRDVFGSLPGGGPAPRLVPGTEYVARAMNPVAIDGLVETDDLLVTVRSERLEGAVGASGLPVGDDINDDGDATDAAILTLRDKGTGDEEAIGLGTGPGRAIARVKRRHPFSTPALAAEDDVVAFLEHEVLEGDCRDPDAIINQGSGAFCDKNDDGDFDDTILRIFRQQGGNPVELTAGQDRAADAAPLVNEGSLAVSDGLVFYRESEAAGTVIARSSVTRVNPASCTPFTCPPPNAPAAEVSISSDGRHVAYATTASNLRIDAGPADTNAATDVYVHDRDADQDGVFDEGAAGATRQVRISLSSLRNQLAGPSASPSMSADGRFVAYEVGPAATGSDTNGAYDVYVWDRDADQDGVFDEIVAGGVSTLRVSVDTNGAQFSGASLNPSISADGTRIAFETKANNPSGPTFVMIRDLALSGTSVVGGCSFGCAGSQNVFTPAISANGEWVAFVAAAGTALNLVPPTSLFDTNNVQDVAVARVSSSGTFISTVQARISLTEDAAGNAVQLDGPSTRPSISADGRYVGFTSNARNAATDTAGAILRTYVRDRDADEDGVYDEFGQKNAHSLRSVVEPYATPGFQTSTIIGAIAPLARRVGVKANAGPLVGVTGSYDVLTDVGALSGAVVDGGPPLYKPALSADGVYFSYDSTGFGPEPGTAYVEGPGAFDLTNDLSADGDHLDTVLAVWDARAGAANPALLPPARAVAVAAGNALFLVPEGEVGASLNGDTDQADGVAHLYRNRQLPAVSLGVAARAVAISGQAVAVLVSEAEHGVALNGDGLADDVLIGVQPLATASAGGWIWLGAGSSAPRVRGSRVAWTVRESEVGASLNGDADTTDVIGQVYDVGLAQWVMGPGGAAPKAVLDLVLGDEIAAFRVSESGQGGASLNGDADAVDGVMHVVDLATRAVTNAGQAATPCPVEACDPQRPYKVLDRTVSYLTLEAEQAVGTGCLPSSPPSQCDLDGDGNAAGPGLVLRHFNALAVSLGASTTDATGVLGAAASGICTVSGVACASDAQCGGGICFVPPGGCIRSLGTSCNPEIAGSCATGFCKPTFGSPGVGVCHVNDGPCSNDDQCANPAAVCSSTGQDFQRVADVFASSDAGGQALVSVGKCVTTTATTCVDDGDCAAEQVCTSAGTCGRPEATCRTTADCRGTAVCLREATVAGSDDADGDGVADAVDGCPGRPDAGQEDGDADGVGDACDRMTCGDGSQTYAETCDDGNRTSGDGCSATCTLEGAAPACSNGRDDDGDGATDAPADPGCANASDTSERAPTLPCDDGLDNDGDFASDLPDDAGCFLPTWSLEDPQCSDGADNDADGLVDLSDPTCAGNAWANAEQPTSSCGLLGIEAAALLAALRALRARRGGARPGSGARPRS